MACAAREIGPRVQGVPIDLEQVKALYREGAGHPRPRDRFVAWTRLLGLYPANPDQWSGKCDGYLASYSGFTEGFGLSQWHAKAIPLPSSPGAFDVGNPELMRSIHGDIVRSLRHFMYFPACLPVAGYDACDPASFFSEHFRRAERILYVFGSVNGSLAYAQGFNELVVPFLFVFGQGRDALRDGAGSCGCTVRAAPRAGCPCPPTSASRGP